jgi:hypothetical protein
MNRGTEEIVSRLQVFIMYALSCKEVLTSGGRSTRQNKMHFPTYSLPFSFPPSNMTQMPLTSMTYLLFTFQRSILVFVFRASSCRSKDSAGVFIWSLLVSLDLDSTAKNVTFSSLPFSGHSPCHRSSRRIFPRCFERGSAPVVSAVGTTVSRSGFLVVLRTVEKDLP